MSLMAILTSGGDAPGMNAAIVAVSIYLPGDILKVILATIVTSAILKARPNSVLTRL